MQSSTFAVETKKMIRSDSSIISVYFLYTYILFLLFKLNEFKLPDLQIKSSLVMMRYWGEIPGPAGVPPSRSSFDLLQREFRSVEMQDPPLHQPSAQRPRPTTMLDIPSEPCSLTIHTVQLCQHTRRLRTLLAAAQSQTQGQSSASSEGGVKLEEADTNLPLRPPTPPAMPDDLLPVDSKAPQQPFQLRHSDPESDFYK